MLYVVNRSWNGDTAFMLYWYQWKCVTVYDGNTVHLSFQATHTRNSTRSNIVETVFYLIRRLLPNKELEVKGSKNVFMALLRYVTNCNSFIILCVDRVRYSNHSFVLLGSLINCSSVITDLFEGSKPRNLRTWLDFVQKKENVLIFRESIRGHVKNIFIRLC